MMGRHYRLGVRIRVRVWVTVTVRVTVTVTVTVAVTAIARITQEQHGFTLIRPSHQLRCWVPGASR